MTAAVDIRDFVVAYETGGGAVFALDGIDLAIGAGETLGIVGESGSGKSTLGMAIGRLLAPNARIDAGDILVAGCSVTTSDDETVRRLRRERLGFVFQNPMSALDPTMRIGRQVALAMEGTPDTAAVERLLVRAGLDEPGRVARSFPHELSGGMAQRVVIALAIARNPQILIADEPTASLDASIRDRILDLLFAMRAETGASLVILSHDLRMIVHRCERVIVMYGGRIVEMGESQAVFGSPAHPYTRALIRAAAGNEAPGEQLDPIPGVPPVLRAPSADCAFAPRCAHAAERCRRERPAERAVGGSRVACHFAEEIMAASGTAREVAE
ncbi:ABC transporter ATP-binding protein [Oceanibacterium hippocampi]|uniref:Oligopeptide transport ATP-binding protein OppD n=1 Tax=Oceanibacterium hippocampi TaxID=745714 RepID=A0A1Y5TGV1_9PROT|nr:ABC transporter ATP-binding protein [Oceanibacterium hippocampi]SLN63357.1 Oligopeptide transport ATP-binding protein OppD [Oceanibacterium hippocampi]